MGARPSSTSGSDLSILQESVPVHSYMFTDSVQAKKTGTVNRVTGSDLLGHVKIRSGQVGATDSAAVVCSVHAT